MLKTTYKQDKFLREENINFKEFKSLIESYFLICEDIIKEVNIRTEFPVTGGVSATFNNKVKINNLYNCFKTYNDNLLIEFEEFKNVFTINENSNVKIDFINNRMFLLDHNITIHFNEQLD